MTVKDRVLARVESAVDGTDSTAIAAAENMTVAQASRVLHFLWFDNRVDRHQQRVPGLRRWTFRYTARRLKRG